MNNDGLTLNQLAERNAVLVTEVEKLRAERDQLAAENVAMKSFGDKLNDMHNALNGEGTGIQGRAEVACQQVALEAAMEEFDAIEPPATDAFLAGIKADAITASLDACSDYLETDCVMDRLDVSYEEAETRTSGAIEFHDAMVNFASQMREGADK
ncbi:hypothetical protein ACR92I_23575 [Klebsiella pneumoniae]